MVWCEVGLIYSGQSEHCCWALVDNRFKPSLVQLFSANQPWQIWFIDLGSAIDFTWSGIFSHYVIAGWAWYQSWNYFWVPPGGMYCSQDKRINIRLLSCVYCMGWHHIRAVLFLIDINEQYFTWTSYRVHFHIIGQFLPGWSFAD